jgi:hypothetical protein
MSFHILVVASHSGIVPVTFLRIPYGAGHLSSDYPRMRPRGHAPILIKQKVGWMFHLREGGGKAVDEFVTAVDDAPQQ